MQPPINSRLEKDGTRTILFSCDIMLNNGTKFYATFHGRLRIRPNFHLGKYMYDPNELVELVEKRYPSLTTRKYTIAL